MISQKHIQEVMVESGFVEIRNDDLGLSLFVRGGCEVEITDDNPNVCTIWVSSNNSDFLDVCHTMSNDLVFLWITSPALFSDMVHERRELLNAKTV